ncbi:MAG: glycyl-radical enzyme activating protein [Clostridia bacterium]|nr:glycyl-radical enzyme activating protein [Clostridia bacterium]MBR2407228.1 glycyl-radical enzyme activating protein [Clostridia bacterium]
MSDYLNVSGRIFDIQKFSVHDGPGVRTIVFFKGCALRCKWCCNPESQKHEIQTMLQNGKEKTIGRDVTVAEVLEIVRQDMPYYRRSGGGLTLSGGEMLCQSDFAYALLRSAKEAAINTAVETTGFASYEVIEKLLPHIDTVLMDIKHTNSQKHKAFTTQPNELILENAVKIAKNAKKLIIRVPVIPTFNDTPEEIGDIAKFAASLEGVTEINLLPYHRFGKDKYDGLNREYLMGDLPSPTDEQMQQLKSVAERYGLTCKIGG